MTREEKENEERRIISAFIEKFADQKLDIQDESQIAYIKKAITDVFRLEIEELGYKIKGEEQEGEEPFEVVFDNNTDGNHRGAYCLDENKIIFYLAKLYEEIILDDKERRIAGCENIFSVVFHEIQHHRQHILSKIDISTKDSILYAKEFILKELLPDLYNGENYDNFAIESNADTTATTQFIRLMNYDDNLKTNYIALLETLRDVYNMNFYTDEFYGEFQYKDKKIKLDYSLPREELFDKIIQLVDVNVFNKYSSKYPLIKKEYQKTTGKVYVERRFVDQLIKNLNGEIKDILSTQDLSDEEKKELTKQVKQAYFEMIYRAIRVEMPPDELIPKTEIDNTSPKYNIDKIIIDYKKLPIEERDGVLIRQHRNSVLKDLIKQFGKNTLQDLVRRNENVF